MRLSGLLDHVPGHSPPDDRSCTAAPALHDRPGRARCSWCGGGDRPPAGGSQRSGCCIEPQTQPERHRARGRAGDLAAAGSPRPFARETL